MVYHSTKAVLGFRLRNLSNKAALTHYYEPCDVAAFVYR